MSEPKKWLPVFLKFIELLRIDSKETPATDERGSRLNLWGSQRRFLDELCYGLDNGVREFCFLKSRQLGITTVSLAIDIFWMAMNNGLIGCLVADTDTNSAGMRNVLRRYIDSFPKGFFGKSFTLLKDNKNFMSFSNGSRLDFLVAGKSKKTWGESKGYALAHLCMAKGTPVITEHGRVKNVEDVKLGDTVLTHTGAKAKVIDVFGQPGKDKPMVKVLPWLGEPIRYTTWHKIPTLRGLIPAGELKEDDFLVMPLRRITGGNHVIKLPKTGARSGTKYVGPDGRFMCKGEEGGVAKIYKDWAGIQSKASGRRMVLTEDVGFAIGYYLAEGCMLWNSLSQPCGIIFARHRNEKRYSDRAVKALSRFTTGHSRTVDNKDSLTTTVSIYGSALARWIESIFGSTDNKHIPDEVFTWGECFCRGMLAGMLCGDGSKGITQGRHSHRKYKDTVSAPGVKIGAKRGLRDSKKRYDLNLIVMPTTRSSLAMQLRDIAAALGYGWASIKYKPAGDWYGRVCKACWRVTWAGKGAADIRELMGLEKVPRKEHDFTNKYVVDGNRVLIKIRSIEKCPEEDEVWDISVDHPDHTFRTLSMSTGNTERSKYGSEEGLASFRETLAETNPNRLVISESTAFGMNHFKDYYEECGRDTLTKHRAFIGWWAKEINSFSKKDPRFPIYGIAEPSAEERELIEVVEERHKHKVTMEQLAWFRWKSSDNSVSDSDMKQNQPWYDAQAFVLSGHSFFRTREIQKDLARIMDEVDEFNERVVQFKGYRMWLGNDFWASRMEHIVDAERIEEIQLRVWEDPVPGARYVIGCDPAFGRNDWKDRSCISVWRCFADKLVQVAEYADNTYETHQTAWVLAYLAGIYQNCTVNIELTGGAGRAVLREFDALRERLKAEIYQKVTEDRGWDNFLFHARHYLYRKSDSFSGGNIKSFDTNGRTKWEIMNQLRDSHSTGIMLINSGPLCAELLGVVQDGYEIGAPGRNKDDRVFGAALANRAWIDDVREPMTRMGQTYAVVMTAENPAEDGSSQGQIIIDNLVADFFKTAAERVDEPSPEEQWMEEKGFV